MMFRPSFRAFRGMVEKLIAAHQIVNPLQSLCLKALRESLQSPEAKPRNNSLTKLDLSKNPLGDARQFCFGDSRVAVRDENVLAHTHTHQHNTVRNSRHATL